MTNIDKKYVFPPANLDAREREREEKTRMHFFLHVLAFFLCRNVAYLLFAKENWSREAHLPNKRNCETKSKCKLCVCVCVRMF